MSKERAAKEDVPEEKAAVLHDRDIREPLFDFLEETYGKVRILEEKRMGSSRADIVMITPEAVVGLEIKSDADTYARLQSQIQDYEKYYDRNYAVVGTRHALHIRERVPEHWGIITVEPEEGKTDFYVLREAKNNPNVDWKKKLSILWRPELVHIQELNAMPAYKRNSKELVIDKILAKVPRELLGPQICEELFERDYDRILEQINAYRQENGMKKRRRRKRRRYKAI
ncbi:MAG: sce7726 family protein [Eubacteriales bacterium]|nr:sce7726 family protein [Eubacteriales bacterium]